jgi:uncharacterized protein (DUF58 family)
VRKRSARRLDVPLDVVPQQVAAADLPALIFGALNGHGAPSAGDQLRGIREWRAGDSPRNVHWRSTARTGALTVVERGEPTRDVLFMLAVGRYAEPSYELAVARAASVAVAALERGTTVRLGWKPGDTGATGPIRGYQLDARSAMIAFARLPSSEPLTAADLAALRAGIPRGAGVLLVTAADDVARRSALVDALGTHATVLG